jgi:hypothetical protein
LFNLLAAAEAVVSAVSDSLVLPLVLEVVAVVAVVVSIVEPTILEVVVGRLGAVLGAAPQAKEVMGAGQAVQMLEEVVVVPMGPLVVAVAVDRAVLMGARPMEELPDTAAAAAVVV